MIQSFQHKSSDVSQGPARFADNKHYAQREKESAKPVIIRIEKARRREQARSDLMQPNIYAKSSKNEKQERGEFIAQPRNRVLGENALEEVHKSSLVLSCTRSLILMHQVVTIVLWNRESQ